MLVKFNENLHRYVDIKKNRFYICKKYKTLSEVKKIYLIRMKKNLIE